MDIINTGHFITTSTDILSWQKNILDLEAERTELRSANERLAAALDENRHLLMNLQDHLPH